MVRLHFALFLVVFLTVESDLLCLNTSLLCNNVCLNASIAQTSILYGMKETGAITLESFEVYMKGLHSQQQDVILDLIHGNISFRLADFGRNGIPNFDVTISDDTVQTLDSQLFGLDCRCTIKPVRGNIINEFGKHVLLNEAYILKISDWGEHHNDTFEQWCITKFCYTKTTENPTIQLIEPVIYPTINPTNSPIKLSTNEIIIVKSKKVNRRRIIFYFTLPIIAFLLGALVMGFCSYKWSLYKNRRRQESYSGTIVNTNGVSVGKSHNRINSEIENTPRIEKRTSEDINGMQHEINERNQLTFM